MWQLYYYDENGKEKHLFKPCNSVEEAEKKAAKFGIMSPYVIRKVSV